MSSTLRSARALCLALAALFASAPGTALRRPAAASAGVVHIAPAAPQAVAPIVDVDPMTASAADLARALVALDETVSSLDRSAVVAERAHAEAVATWEAAAEALAATPASPAPPTGTRAFIGRTASTAVPGGEHTDVPAGPHAPRLGTSDTGPIVPAVPLLAAADAPAVAAAVPLAASRLTVAGAAADTPLAVVAVEEASAAATLAAEERRARALATSLADVQADGTGFVARAQARVVDDLLEAAAVAPVDRAAAEAKRAEAVAIAGALGQLTELGPVAASPPPAPTPPPRPAPPAAPPAPPAPPPAPPPPPLPDPSGSLSGALAAVPCPNGEHIVVDQSIVAGLQALVDGAHAGGVDLCATSGFRSRGEQIELRRAHCGTSDHAVFQAPSSACSPPTARPGTSNHETGVAIDFSCGDGRSMTHASPCYQWLAAHAGAYGLHNLPSEAWHWSVDGT